MEKNLQRVENFIVIYDVIATKEYRWMSESQRRRTKLLRILLEYGIRTQKSVVEIKIKPSKLQKLVSLIEKTILITLDKVYIYPLERKSIKKTERKGKIISILDNIYI